MKSFVLIFIIASFVRGMDSLFIKKIKDNNKEEVYCKTMVKVAKESKDNPFLKQINDSEHFKSMESCLKMFE